MSVKGRGRDIRDPVPVRCLRIDQGRYLRPMLESVLGQSYGNFELVIADASKEERVEQVVKKLRRFKDPLPAAETKCRISAKQIAAHVATGDMRRF